MVAGHFNLGVCFDTWRQAGTRDWLLMVTERGQGRVGHLQGDVHVRPGDVVLLRPGVRHDYGSERAQTEWEFYWAHFLPLPDWMPWLAWPEVAPGILRVHLQSREECRAVSGACATMVRRGLVQTVHGEALAMNALAEVVLRCDAVRARAVQVQLDPRVERAITHCTQHLHETVMLADLARVGGLSEARFSRLFRRELGLPPMRYLEQLRINRACRLLELSQAKIESVARQVGFANPFYFTLRFKRQLGVSPLSYRRQSGRRAGAADRPGPTAPPMPAPGPTRGAGARSGRAAPRPDSGSRADP
jgi:AraC family transcriptional regulator, arabinose operon regulatory protein